MQSTATAREMPNEMPVKNKEQIAKDIHDGIGVVRDDLEGVARQAGHRVREVADSYGHTVADVVEDMKSKMRDKPLQYGAMAVGIGFVLGKLLRR